MSKIVRCGTEKIVAFLYGMAYIHMPVTLNDDIGRYKMSDAEFLTTKDAAVMCHVAVPTIRRWLREGQLLGEKIGKRKWVIERAELIRFLRPKNTLPAEELT
jgi:excisionase family DNA binding protein